MKLVTCDRCGEYRALTYEWWKCSLPCGQTGGMYRDDGDTVLVTKAARIVGVCNHLLFPRFFSKWHVSGCSNAWPYPENHKVTRILPCDAPTTYQEEER